MLAGHFGIAELPGLTHRSGMTEILQNRLPEPLFADPRAGRLPGTGPVAPGGLILIDDAFASQMAERDRLIDSQRGDVIAETTTPRVVTDELIDRVLEELRDRPGYRFDAENLTRPDGVQVTIERGDPFATLGRLSQSDICLLQRQDDEHVLTGAVLCFPASWMLSEKIGRPLVAIHAPVASYDDVAARRVQRLFDALQPERPIWRANLLRYNDPVLFQPRSANDRRVQPGGQARYLRSERQSLVKLKNSGAVAFIIHTTIVEDSHDVEAVNGA